MLTAIFYWPFCQACSGRFCITYLYQRKSDKQIRDNIDINFPCLFSNKQISTNLQQRNHFRYMKKSYFANQILREYQKYLQKMQYCRKRSSKAAQLSFSVSFIITIAGHKADMNLFYFSFGLTIFSQLPLSPKDRVRSWNYKIPERKTYLWKKGEERKPGPLWQNKSHGLSSMQIWQC